ncbi:signal transduction protein [Veronia nyctiphanis]|uniref:Signal transduction protein n=1 Tax=Veronia nyctiphanis TaxID=1278244 RepID=A0A4Q0YTD9_9GAMM|nr:HDOD domain-containing protein [Veronia nyctiphanis]RXJ74487.1 signal transduction protein [Veronia nyctiphanis]
MAEVFFSCQPVFDAELKHWGSDLLFREGFENKFPSIDEDTATSRVLSANFLASSNKPGARYIVNFSESSLMDEIPLSMPPDELVISVTRDSTPNQALIDKLKSYRMAGYQLLIDGDAFQNSWNQYLELFDIFRVSMEAENPANWENITTKYANKTFLACKVETQEELMMAKQFGFLLFQGYFFEKPQIMKSEDVAPSVLTLLDVCIIINRSPHDIDGLTQLISKDVSLLYKVVASANILAKTKSSAITNPRQAVVYLGVESLRRLVSLLIMSNMSNQAAAQLQNSALLRATFMSTIGVDDEKFNPDEGFIAGAFSLLDVMLGKPMEEIIQNLDLSYEVKRAMVSQEGLYGDALKLCKDIERANWNGVTHWCNQFSVSDKTVLKTYEKCRDDTAVIMASMQV